MTNNTFTYRFTSDDTAEMSNNSVTIVPTDDLKVYADFIRGLINDMPTLCHPTDDDWDSLVLILAEECPRGEVVDYAHRVTKIVSLINTYCKDEDKIEYNFVGRTHRVLDEYYPLNLG